jgi:hypothetical protein
MCRFTKRSDKQKVVAPVSIKALILMKSFSQGFLTDTWKMGRWPMVGGVTEKGEGFLVALPSGHKGSSEGSCFRLTPWEVPVLGSSEELIPAMTTNGKGSSTWFPAEETNSVNAEVLDVRQTCWIGRRSRTRS